MSPPVSPLFPDDVKAKLVSQMHMDPQVPRNDPTVTTWQLPPHPLSEIQSEHLSPITDMAIIGSGVTGCSVSSNLLKNPLLGDRTVTVFEARTLTSGATSRNAGFLLSHIPKYFKEMVEGYGEERAISIARFCNMTLDKMSKLATSEGLGPDVEKASEKRPVQAILAYDKEESLQARLESIQLYEEVFPERKGLYSTITPETAEKVYRLKGTAGALSTPAEVFWPYRLITRVFESLLDRYRGRFSIETKTPVTSIIYSPETDAKHPYILSTPRGNVRAGQVFHCSNAFAGHLLPNLRGKIFPTRHINSCQKPGPQFPNLGAKQCWMWFGTPNYDPTSGLFETGLYYMQQNHHTGDLFFGGNKAHIDDIVNSDDGKVSPFQKNNVSTILPTLFDKRWNDPVRGSIQRPVVDKVWSGIIGSTPDYLPLVGKLPASVTGRGNFGGGEWIAAGYNGYGMAQCWSCGEAISRMALGEATPDWLPDAYFVTEERLGDEMRMGIEAALGALG